MTYHYPVTPKHRAAAWQQVPPSMQLIPLHSLQAAPRSVLQRFGLKQLLIVVAVIVLILAVMYLLEKMSNQAPKKRPVRSNARKRSTAEMARTLYKRLDERGGISTTTMKSLKQLGLRS